MRRFAFFLSSEKYKHYSDTPYCHADAELLRKTLIDNCDYLSENSPILKLKKDDGITTEQIFEQVRDLVDRADDGDSILFFYAGHGVAIESNTYLVLPETSPFNETNTALKLSDINHYLSKNKRLNIRIFDCCHSGEGSRDATIESKAEEFVRAVLTEGNDCSLTLASCAANEKSYPDEALGNGVFTSSLVSAINAQKTDTDIYLEILKIEVCNLVQTWCKKRGKSQTPTLSAQLSGNIPIARRKTPIKSDINQLAPKVLSVSDRLSNARQLELVNDKFYPILEAGLNTIASEFEKLAQNSNTYGVPLEKMAVQKVEDIPEFLKQRIIGRMMAYQTMHFMSVNRVERPQPKSIFSSPFFETKPIYDTYYEINQTCRMPDCFQTFESTTDGYLPSSSIFFYICPLQTSIAVLTGYFFDKSYNSAKSNISLKKISHETYSIPDFRDKKYLLPLKNFLTAFQFDFGVEIDERLTYLEKENQSVIKSHSQ